MWAHCAIDKERERERGREGGEGERCIVKRTPTHEDKISA